MEYEGRICNTPTERASFKLPVSVGCPYNDCSFCGLFKHLKYRQLPLSQIEEELLRVKQVDGKPQRIMLGDGNAMSLPFDRLQEIFRLIHLHLPSVVEICMDATVTSIQEKTDAQLQALAQDGLVSLYIGVESGLDDVLEFMCKDHLNPEFRTAVARLHEAGIEFGAHIMTGVAGKGRGLENARATAQLLNETKPEYICNFSMITEDHDVPLQDDIRENRFVPASEWESLQEDAELIRNLDISVRYDGFHDMIGLRVRGMLPQDRQKILDALHSAMDSLV